MLQSLQFNVRFHKYRILEIEKLVIFFRWVRGKINSRGRNFANLLLWPDDAHFYDFEQSNLIIL